MSFGELLTTTTSHFQFEIDIVSQQKNFWDLKKKQINSFILRTDIFFKESYIFFRQFFKNDNVSKDIEAFVDFFLYNEIFLIIFIFFKLI